MSTSPLPFLTFATMFFIASSLAFVLWRGYKKMLNNQDSMFRAYIDMHPRWHSFVKFAMLALVVVFCIEAIHAGLQCVLVVLK